MHGHAWVSEQDRWRLTYIFTRKQIPSFIACWTDSTSFNTFSLRTYGAAPERATSLPSVADAEMTLKTTPNRENLMFSAFQPTVAHTENVP